MAFDSVLGHARVRGLLSHALRQGRLPPALLLVGPEGVGKKTLALAVARALVCEKQDGDACDACAVCRRSLRGLHPDLFLVQPETAVIKIEQIRDVVREILALPFEGKARGFVVDDAHAMTPQGANALLKSLEEPPASSHVILVSASPQALLPTIRSRCQTLRLGLLPAALLEAHLRQSLGLSADEARLRSGLSGGSLGAAIALESEAYQSLRDELLAFMEAAHTSGVVGRMESAEKLGEQPDVALALTAMRSLLRDVAALRAGLPASRLLNPDVAPRLATLAQGRLGARAAHLADTVGETRVALQGNAQKLLSLDLLLDAFAG